MTEQERVEAPSADAKHDGNGSRWYFAVWEGLCQRVHQKQMGSALWLYLWILARAHLKGNRGQIQYNHEEVADDLGVTSRTIKTWFRTLQENGYLITRARHPHNLEVRVTNWRAVEEFHKARTGLAEVKAYSLLSASEVKDSSSLHNEGERSEESFTSPKSEVKVSSLHAGRSEVRSEERSEVLRQHTITIKLENYHYPSGSAGAEPAPELVSVAALFQDLLARLKVATNKPAVLREIYQLCFGGRAEDLPEYGYLGKVAIAVGGAGRLAEVMWMLTVKPPTGDVLAYILEAEKQRKGQARRNGQAEKLPTAEEWTAKAFERGVIRRAEEPEE